MTDKNSSESRRKLLKSIAAGSGAIVAGKSLPESWSRPVVDSVMLPAHAQTSPPVQTIFAGPSDPSSVGSIQPNNMMADAIDALVPTAMAQERSYMAYLCITDIGGGQAKVEAVIEDSGIASSLFGATVPADGTAYDLGLIENGCDRVADGSLMDKLGLVKDAKAGFAVEQDATISITFGASAMGAVNYNDNIMTYNIDGTRCDLPDLICQPPV